MVYYLPKCWLIFMVNVGKYTIHGAFGYVSIAVWIPQKFERNSLETFFCLECQENGLWLISHLVVGTA